MRFLAQLSRTDSAFTGFLPWLPGVPTLALALLAGCQPEAPQARPAEVPEFTPLSVVLAESDAIPPTTDTARPAGLGETWTYAASLDDFHDTWLTRFALSADPPASENALLPYADAISYQGSAWGLDPADIGVVLLQPDGSAKHFRGVQHPTSDPTEASVAQGRPEMFVPDWSSLEVDGSIKLRSDGLGLFVAGPVVASDCKQCHDYPTGQVLGALIYRFTEIADD